MNIVALAARLQGNKFQRPFGEWARDVGAKLCPLVGAERRAFVQQRGVEEIHPARNVRYT